MILRPEFATVFAYLASAYPQRTYTKETISVYYDTLADLDSAALMLACKTWVSEEKWFPKASELRRLAYGCGHVETSEDRLRKYAGSIELMNAALAWRSKRLPQGAAKRLTKGGNDGQRQDEQTE